VPWSTGIERMSTTNGVMAPKCLPSRMHASSVRNDVPDNPGETAADKRPESLANMGGNRVVLDLGGGKRAADQMPMDGWVITIDQ